MSSIKFAGTEAYRFLPPPPPPPKKKKRAGAWVGIVPVLCCKQFRWQKGRRPHLPQEKSNVEIKAEHFAT